MIATLFISIASNAFSVHAVQPRPEKPPLETTIGMEGTYWLRHAGSPLEAKPFEENSPVTVRIAYVDRRQGEVPLYELKYVGTRAGKFDLRDYLTFVDGRPASSLEPMQITVKELLPANHIGDLEELAAVQAPRPWSYRRWVQVVIAAWALPAVGFVVVRLLRRKKAPPPILVETLSTEAELRALVDIALAGGLDTAKQARLEELLIRYWRESLDAGTTPTLELIARLKREPRTAPLIAQLETWLYRRPEAAAVGGSQIDVEKLLAPYRTATVSSQAQAARSGR